MMAMKCFTRNGRARPRPIAHAVAGALMLLAQCSYVLAQNAASILPPAKTIFLNQNGQPLIGGKVSTFVPNTVVPKTTWQDNQQATPNANPVILDAAGGAFIFGQGSYTEQVQDINGNLVWSGFTQAPGTAIPLGGSAQDTAPIGTVMPFSGFTVPVNWALAFGQAVSRVNFPALLSTITISSTSASCQITSSQIGGFADTSQMAIGEPVEATCIPGGSVIQSIINATTIQVSHAATATGTVTATVFPWGNGDGSTTFNVPDLRGRAVAGADAMGGVAANRLTSAFYGATAKPAVAGGSQSSTLVQANLPNVSFTVSGITLNDPGHTHAVNVNSTSVSSALPTGTKYLGNGTNNIFETTTNATNTVMNASATTGITVSSQGSAASGGSGSAFGVIQPSVTLNYIIKVTPAVSGAGGVTSFGGMSGDIVCQNSLTCAPVGATNFVSCTVGGSSQLGCVMPDNVTLTVAGNGALNCTTATTLVLGCVKPDNNTIVNAAGAISVSLTNLLPVATRAGDVIYWNGSIWTHFAGNNSGTLCLSENASGVPAWSTCSAGTGTPGGSSGAVQFNSSSTFGGISGVTSNGTVITIASGDLQLSGATSGTSILNAPATGGGTATLFAGTDTIAGLATVQTFSGNDTFSGNNTFSGANSFSAGKTQTVAGTLNVTGTFQSGSNTMTFPSGAATLAALNVTDQTLSGGANVTASNQGTKSSGTFTVDCGVVPLQYFTNGGAFTLAAPTHDGSCDLLDTNNASAGAITFSSFTVGSNTGDALTTTNTSKFIIHIERINGTATYFVKALQ